MGVADKASRPLFELMGQSRPSAESREDAGGGASAGAGGSYLRVPTAALWTGVAVALGVVVLTWAVAYQAGVSAGKAAMAAEQTPRELDGLRVSDPEANTGQPVTDGRGTPGNAGGSGQGSNTPSAADGSGDHRVLTATGWAPHDPRIPDTNYLELATLSEGSAKEAIAYLARSNIRVIGVPQSGGKVTLYSLDVPIPSGEWARMRAQGEAHRRRVSQIGAQWQRDERGESDFSKSYYRKYEG